MIDIAECKENLLRKESVRREKNRVLWMRAKQDAESIIAMIADKYASSPESVGKKVRFWEISERVVEGKF